MLMRSAWEDLSNESLYPPIKNIRLLVSHVWTWDYYDGIVYDTLLRIIDILFSDIPVCVCHLKEFGLSKNLSSPFCFSLEDYETVGKVKECWYMFVDESRTGFEITEVLILL